MLPDAQHFMRPGIIEFTWGHPDLALFPTEALARAATLALSRDDRAELCYGAVQGPGSLIRQLCAWLGQREGRAIPQERMFIAGGLSQGLDLLCTLYHPTGRRDPGRFADVSPGAARLPRSWAGADPGRRRRGRAAPRCPGRRAGALAPRASTGALPLPRAELRQSDRRDDAARAAAGDRRPGPRGRPDDPGRRRLSPSVVRRAATAAAFRSLARPRHPARLVQQAARARPARRLADRAACGRAEVRRQRSARQRRRGQSLCGACGGGVHGAGRLRCARGDAARRLSSAARHPLRLRWRAIFPMAASGRRPAAASSSGCGCRRGSTASSCCRGLRQPGCPTCPGSRFCADGGGRSYIRLAFTLLSPAEMEEGAMRLGQVLREGRR